MTDLRTAAQQALEALALAQLNGEAGLRDYEVLEIAESAVALEAALAEPKSHASDDPHRDHWVAIAEAAQRIADSKECGPAEAASFCAAIERLGSALAEPVQKPVANRAFLERVLTAMESVIDVADRKTDEFDALRSCVIDLTMMLHTAPPQRRPLSDEEIDQAANNIFTDDPVQWRRKLARAIERAHGI